MDKPHSLINTLEPLKKMLHQTELKIGELEQADPSSFIRGEAGKEKALADAKKKKEQLSKAIQLNGSAKS